MSRLLEDSRALEIGVLTGVSLSAGVALFGGDDVDALVERAGCDGDEEDSVVELAGAVSRGLVGIATS